MARKVQYHIKAENPVIKHLQQNAHRYQGALNALEVDAFRLLNDNGATSKFGVKDGLAYLRIKPQNGQKLDRIYLLKETSDQASVEQNQRIRREVQAAIHKTNEVQRAHVEALRARGQQVGMPGLLHRSGSVQTQTQVPVTPQTPVVPRTPAAPQAPAQSRNIFANRTTPQRNFNIADFNGGLTEDEAFHLAQSASRESGVYQEAARPIAQAQRAGRQTEFNGAFNEAEALRLAQQESLQGEYMPNLIDLELNGTSSQAAATVSSDITSAEWEQIRLNQIVADAEAVLRDRRNNPYLRQS